MNSRVDTGEPDSFVGARGNSLVVHAVTAASATGRVRSTNEDRWARRGDRVFAIADGVGSLPGGAAAAETAVRAAVALSAAHVAAIPSVVVDSLNSAVVDAASAHDRPRMATTVAVLAITDGVASVIGVGDSRIYLSRGGQLEQLTEDHSVGADLRRDGLDVQAAQARGVRTDALTGYLGWRGVGAPRHSHRAFGLCGGDRLLMCTDGIHAVLTHEDLAQALVQRDCQDVVGRLLSLSDERGGPDNATALLVDVWERTNE